MRMVRLQFNNVTDHVEVLKVLAHLTSMGTLHSHSFDSRNVGYGEAVLCTELTDRQLQDQLGSLFPDMMTGVASLNEEHCHDCPAAA